MSRLVRTFSCPSARGGRVDRHELFHFVESRSGSRSAGGRGFFPPTLEIFGDSADHNLPFTFYKFGMDYQCRKASTFPILGRLHFWLPLISKHGQAACSSLTIRLS